MEFPRYMIYLFVWCLFGFFFGAATGLATAIFCFLFCFYGLLVYFHGVKYRRSLWGRFVLLLFVRASGFFFLFVVFKDNKSIPNTIKTYRFPLGLGFCLVRTTWLVRKVSADSRVSRSSSPQRYRQLASSHVFFPSPFFFFFFFTVHGMR